MRHLKELFCCLIKGTISCSLTFASASLVFYCRRAVQDITDITKNYWEFTCASSCGMEVKKSWCTLNNWAGRRLVPSPPPPPPSHVFANQGLSNINQFGSASLIITISGYLYIFYKGNISIKCCNSKWPSNYVAIKLERYVCTVAQKTR